MFLGKGVLKISSKFTEKHPCWSAISIKLLCDFIKVTLRHGYSPVNLLHIFRTVFPTSMPGRLLLSLPKYIKLHLTNRFNQIQYACCDNYFFINEEMCFWIQTEMKTLKNTEYWLLFSLHLFDPQLTTPCSSQWPRYVYEQMDHHWHLDNH